MLRIVDYAKGKDIEWYEVIRQAINEESAAPVVILTRGELRVYELDPGKILGDSPLDKVQLKALLPLVSTATTIGIPVTGLTLCTSSR